MAVAVPEAEDDRVWLHAAHAGNAHQVLHALPHRGGQGQLGERLHLESGAGQRGPLERGGLHLESGAGQWGLAAPQSSEDSLSEQYNIFNRTCFNF